ncbi:MAG: ATP synthase F1 subunit epsilon [Gemmataceae bacterium]
METTGKQMKCVVVTPERAVLDETVEFVSLPMFDGELGVLPGRAPLIGRLGSGELRLQHGAHVRRYFVDGGFAQVRSNVVTVLTSKAVQAESIDRNLALQQLASAQAMMPKTPIEYATRQRTEAGARAMIRIAEKRDA